jgi:hypothetical protein
MNFKTVKKSEARGVRLDGITVEWEWRDSELDAVTITDGRGQVLKVAKNAYSMHALTLAPVEKKTVHVVKGTVRAVNTPVREEFEGAWSAQQRARELSSADVLDGAATVEKEEVEIPF